MLHSTSHPMPKNENNAMEKNLQRSERKSNRTLLPSTSKVTSKKMQKKNILKF